MRAENLSKVSSETSWVKQFWGKNCKQCQHWAMTSIAYRKEMRVHKQWAGPAEVGGQVYVFGPNQTKYRFHHNVHWFLALSFKIRMFMQFWRWYQCCQLFFPKCSQARSKNSQKNRQSEWKIAEVANNKNHQKDWISMKFFS